MFLSAGSPLPTDVWNARHSLSSSFASSRVMMLLNEGPVLTSVGSEVLYCISCWEISSSDTTISYTSNHSLGSESKDAEFTRLDFWFLLFVLSALSRLNFLRLAVMGLRFIGSRHLPIVQFSRSQLNHKRFGSEPDLRLNVASRGGSWSLAVHWPRVLSDFFFRDKNFYGTCIAPSSMESKMH